MKISSTLSWTSAIVSSPLDLGTAEVPVKHEFELTNDHPIHHAAGRRAPNHNDAIQNELDGILKAGIVTPPLLV